MKTFLKIFSITFIFLTVESIGNTQPIIWQRVYGNNENGDAGRDILQTFDGGYIVCGITAYSDANIYLIKTNSLGIKLWEKTISDSSGYMIALSIQQTLDSGYVMTGRRDRDLCILKIDKIGNLQWKKNFNRSGGLANGRSIKITSDNGFIVCGEIFYSSPFIEKTYIVKTDSNGNLQWDGLYGDSTNNNSFDIVESLERNFYISGRFNDNFSASEYYAYILKINSNGNKIWNINNWKKFAVRIVQFDFESIYTGGGDSAGNTILSKFDSAGNVVWNRIIKPWTLNNTFSFRSMCKIDSLRIVFAGNKVTGNYYNFSAIKMDLNGNVTLEKTLATPSNVINSVYSIRNTQDGGFIFVGDTEFGGSKFSTNILAVKTDSIFNTTPVVSISNNTITLSNSFTLHQNYPNPFNPTTIIRYELSKHSDVSLKVYDILGKEIMTLVNQLQNTGTYNATVNGSNLAGGIYFYKLFINGNAIDTKRMVLLK